MHCLLVAGFGCDTERQGKQQPEHGPPSGGQIGLSVPRPETAVAPTDSGLPGGEEGRLREQVL